MFDLIPGAASLEAELQPEADIVSLARELLLEAEEHRHRRTIVLAGEANWGRNHATNIIALPELRRVSWVTSDTLENTEVVSVGNAKRLLGQERDAVVFDAHCGFDPDAFGAVSGIIRGGGLLVLLCPPLQKWEHIPDPASERIAISPFHYQDISGRFIRRLVGVLNEAKGICRIEQGRPLPSLKSVSGESSISSVTKITADDVCRTDDQKKAVEAIEHVVSGHRRRPVVLISDRGRGKTAALGIAAAKLLLEAESGNAGSRRSMHIMVTAPQRTAVDTLFSHALQCLPDAELHENVLAWNTSRIQFIDPDTLYTSREHADLVMVDEAAAIPTPILTTLLENYSRIVFATTVHGYEGTGRGFAIRFRKTLDEKTPGWREVLLTQPIRWSEHDPLERLVFRSLLLDAECLEDKEVEKLKTDLRSEEVAMECIDRDDLVNDEHTLSQLFGLLVSAHYQTTPNDLRNLLDGPGVSVYVMRTGATESKKLIATVLVSAEGNFSDELADAIFKGKRRPRGHLIPQSLVTHMGIRQAASLRCARIMRIAVHPALQNQGLGSMFIRYIRENVKREGFDLLGTSYGATPELLSFWKAQDLLPVRTGFRRDVASGEHSVMMLSALGNENNEAQSVVKEARERFCADLPHWLSDGLRDLDSGMVLALLRGGQYKMPFSHGDQQMLAGFVSGARGYEDCSAVLWRYSLMALSSTSDKPQGTEYTALVARVIQKRSWEEVVTLCGCSGRRDIIALLRSAVSSLLEVIPLEKADVD